MPRNKHGGIRKRCECPRKHWPKCDHAWWLYFQWKKQPYRFSMDQELGRPIKSKSEAEAEADRFRTAIREGRFRVPEPAPVEPPPAPITLREYVTKEWAPTAEANIKTSTARFYTDHLENHISPLLGDRPLSELSRRDCRQLIAETRAKGLKITTVRGIVRTLSTVLAQAVDDEYLPANPAQALRKYLRTGDDAEAKVDPFTREEAERLLRAAREHYPEWYPWVLCALRTGMRVGELLALQWGDIDWYGRYVQVERNIVRGTHTTPKNHQTRRVDVSPQLRAELRLWRRQQHRKWAAKDLPRPEWVFPSAVGTPFDDANVRKWFHLILDKAGLHRRGQHQMRHTFASLLLQANEPITYVSRQLGHKDSSITLRVYAHWLPDSTTTRKGVDALDAPQTRIAQPLHTPARTTLRRIA